MKNFSRQNAGIYFGLTQMTSKVAVAYILPHHDDELFIIPKISSDLKAHKNVYVFYLMNASLSSPIRSSESLIFLKRLGISSDNIIFVGNNLQARDGQIHTVLSEIYSIMKTCFQQNYIQEIVCPAYEGGHQDHDSAAVIARALGNYFQIKITEFYLYNGMKTKGKFYRVAFPLSKTNMGLNFSFNDVKHLLMGPLTYRSQWSAMLGLMPPLIITALLSLIFGVKLKINQIAPPYNFPQFSIKHIPLYERWKRMTYIELTKYHNDFWLTLTKV